jgi:two-component system, cell cycle sensor histidine kinase and response regulator CckA
MPFSTPTVAPTPVAASARAVKFGLAGLFLLTAAVWFGSRTLLATNFLPHWFCFVGNKRLLWTNVIADLLIGISYVVISGTLAWLVRRAGRDLPYTGFFWAFGLFIVSCGGTHFMEVLTVWKPVYWLSAAVKIVTAVASVGTAVVLLITADDIVVFVRNARETAIRHGNERYRALIQATPMAVVGSDLEGKISDWNPAAEALFGWNAEEVIGHPLPFATPAMGEERTAQIEKVLGGAEIKGIETVRVNRKGDQISISLSAAPVYDQSGALSGVIRVFEDISERKRLETQVRQAQKMEVLGRLAGGVAHDFNNMLMVLGGCSELLDRSLPRESPARIYLDQIQRATEKAAAITTQLLAFSRKQMLEFRPMDLHQALMESEFMLPRLLGSDIELTFSHAAKKSWICSDAGQIEQVVANLAINSRDAMPEGGHLTISTRNAAHLPEGSEGTPTLSGDWVVLEVADTGCGMDEKTRAQIFEPFFTTKPQGKGTGLGLATVYGFVKQSRGQIRVETTLGKGTRFELYFPLVEPVVAEPQSSAPVHIGAVSGSGATILVADDEVGLRQALVEILRTSGYEVLEAQSATEALELARHHTAKLDILLTDVVMPGLRGTELARRVTEIHPEIQVVYMSGYAEGFPETERSPNSAVLQKPFRFATLLEQLKLVRHKA